MAHVFGYPSRKTLKKSLLKLSFMLSFAVLAAVLIYNPSGNRDHEIYSSVAVGLGLGLAMLFVYMRIDPMGFKRLVTPRVFENHINQDIAVADVLSNLNSNTFVFHNFIFELFRVEHLVVSPKGIFVIAKIREAGDLHIKNDTLFCGRHSLDTITANTWRICHMVAIILKKYFETDYLPQHILVTPGVPGIAEFNGITLIPNDELTSFIESRTSPMSHETAVSFSSFMTRRYPSGL